MMFKKALYLGTLFFCLPLFAQNEINLDDFKSSLESKAVEKVNEYLEKELPFVELKYFGSNNDNSESGYGVTYDWSTEKPGTTSISENSDRFSVFSYSAHAKGSYAFSDKTNPADLSQAGFSIRYTRASQISIPREDVLSNEDNATYEQECLSGFGDDPAWCSEIDTQLNKFIVNEDESTHIWNGSLNVEVQGNENYSERDTVYSAHLGLLYFPAKDSLLRSANILEWPFRYITRPLTDYRSETTNDRALPSFTLGVDSVDPSDNEMRNNISGNQDSYRRAYFEMGYTTTLGIYKEHNVKFGLMYRYFEELSPDPLVEAAGLDTFKHTTAVISIPARAFNIEVPQMINISYVKGELPFNLQSQEVFQIGFRANVHLGALFGLE